LFHQKRKAMKRTIIKIDEEKCNGCGQCISGCHEGALQLVDGKARMISELYCDGLGACIGECPVGAIELVEAEALPYNETATIKRIAATGRNTVIAHLKHLANHKQAEYIQEAVKWLRANGHDIKPSDFMADEATHQQLHAQAHGFKPAAATHVHESGGCPGSAMRDFRQLAPTPVATNSTVASQLRQWPVQLHLLNPQAPYLNGADLLVAADCTAFSVGNFHDVFLKGKALAIACPKLDSNKEIYIEKLAEMIDRSRLNTITVMMMEVPCCGGLQQLVSMALAKAQRKVPMKKIIVSLKGEILAEEWV
jgi:Pyruvate/2-oxoacid:ferredoxin oxidoreductase delta subunit